MRRSCSAEPSNELWAPIFAVKILEQSCSTSGLPVRAKTCTTPTETRGIACFGKESCY